MEYKGIKVREKPFFWNFIPWLSSYTAQAIISQIFVSKGIFKDLRSKKTNPKTIAVLEHERKHIERQKEIGAFRFGIKYFLSPSFRFKEELLAIKESMKCFKNNNLIFNTERSARFLSSWLYLWMTSYGKAKEKLDEIWRSV